MPSEAGAAAYLRYATLLPSNRSGLRAMLPPEAGRIAANIAKLPELVRRS